MTQDVINKTNDNQIRTVKKYTNKLICHEIKEKYKIKKNPTILYIIFYNILSMNKSIDIEVN